MATPGGPGSLKKDPKKDESIFDKIGGTLARKKKTKEAEVVAEEGRHAIEYPSSPTMPYLGPERMMLDEGEERSIIDPDHKNPKLLELQKLLVDWINDVLAEHRIIVKDLKEDLYDGLILQKLVERLANVDIKEMPEVIQSEMGQKQKLQRVIDMINRILGTPPNMTNKWAVDSIHSKDLIAILHLLVALARHFRAPIRLPENCTVTLLVVQKKEGGLLQTRRTVEEITTTNDDIGARYERDAFDTLLDHAPDKLNVVKKSLIDFVNKHLNHINLEVTDLDVQFSDGVYLILLMGLLEGYFVPLYQFYPTPENNEQKVLNVQFAFELMEDAGLPRPKARPGDIVNRDLKSTLRVLYGLFTRYKSLN